jgi:hypothetical protein
MGANPPHEKLIFHPGFDHEAGRISRGTTRALSCSWHLRSIPPGDLRYRRVRALD